MSAELPRLRVSMLACIQTDVRGQLGGRYSRTCQGWGQHRYHRGQHVLWGMWVGSVFPDAFSTLVGSKRSRWKEVNWLWFISPHTSRVSQTMGLPSCFLPTPKPTHPPEIHQHRHSVAYIPCWRGEASWHRVYIWRNLKRMKEFIKCMAGEL